MRKSRYSEEQISRVLRQVESGQKVKDVIREHGISEQTYYRWKYRDRRLAVRLQPRAAPQLPGAAAACCLC